MSILDGLNKEQLAAVLKTDGPIMILAGAGSGKTRTLVSKIAYLMQEKEVPPYKVLALTFSNKAAKEMRDRISHTLSLDPSMIKVTTFHSFSSQLLRREALNLSLSKSFTIYDQSESKAIVSALLYKRGISPKDLSPYEILDYIDEIKNNGYYLGSKRPDFSPDLSDEYYQYYVDYEHELHRANAVDFGGLITAVIELFDRFPEVLKTYVDRFDYVFVDEYQDTNRAQFILLKQLCDIKKNICVVGDEDQSIYSWRGADIRNILDFEKVFNDVEIFKLEENYRSSKNIIEAASILIDKNKARKGKKMFTHNQEGEKIDLIDCSSDKKEAAFIGDEVARLISSGESASDIAVFYRANHQSRMIEDVLLRHNIAYRVIGGIRFYERKEVKDMLAYLRVLVNSKDSLAFVRIINTPTRGIGATSVKKFEEEATRLNLSLWEMCCDLVEKPQNYSHIKLSGKAKSELVSLVNLLQEAKLMAQDSVLPSIIYNKLLQESGYLKSISGKDYESVARAENLKELLSAITQHEEQQRPATLTSFLETITLDNMAVENVVDEFGKKIKNEEVSLMTVHGAKGLEFPYVFVAGCEENVFPSYKSLERGSWAIEEERRLFYVAMTRAMKKLYLSFAQGRYLFGRLTFNCASRFISEIPTEFFLKRKVIDDRFGSQKNSDYDYQDDSYDKASDTIYSPTKVIHKFQQKIDYTYPKNSSVVHKLYGEGVALDSEGVGINEKVTVLFKDGTKKKFVVSFAPITKK